MLTFNLGWNENAKNLKLFTDVRELQKQLKAKGIELTIEADEPTEGLAYFTIEEPGGNQILVNQHR